MIGPDEYVTQVIREFPFGYYGVDTDDDEFVEPLALALEPVILVRQRHAAAAVSRRISETLSGASRELRAATLREAAEDLPIDGHHGPAFLRARAQRIEDEDE